MAIIACKECGHDVSTQAAGCPHCGAPNARPAAEPKAGPGPSVRQRTLLALVALAVVGTALWLAAARHGPLTETFARWRAQHSSPQPESAAATAPLSSTAPLSPAMPPQADSAAVGPPPVYATTAEQLYRDYGANAVATQNRIGNGRVRVTGSVTEIDEDLAGRAVVKLASGGAASTDMLLRDDQKDAAAQLIKGESVGIQCDKIQRDPVQHSGAPQGSGCVLLLIEAGDKSVYLAVSSANAKAKAPLYIVGPMPESICWSRADMISNQLSGNFDREDIIAKRCSPTARESVPASDCHLSSSMPALPDMPDTHLWRYDCTAASPAAPRRVVDRKSAAHKSEQKHTASSEESADSTATAAALPPAPNPSGAAPASTVTAAPIITALQSTPAVSSNSTGVAGIPPTGAADGVALPTAAASTVTGAAGPVGNVAPNVTPNAKDVASPATVSPQTPSPSQAPSPSQTPSPSATPALPPDLAAVKASDPTAADRIASYCDSVTAAAKDHASVAANCRNDEEAAWKRLVVNNEFPSLNEATRHKCNEPPFPDSYVAKESCARYLQAK